ncbi:bifunctional diaminohydroxyphosphoribosylaminopyrimidine deaminase/5-amino-6-(5-phosphoribosylamino)uracil reductase RibD [Salegentibacter sp.]|uniref:bifunctional diaminohydroxyphosphoribosylaminopyrimidine deaminase/5-amino-6-(5-phosphoribosylamino)uracil reductase RibD n=1 Tax=Salegentibacter sp. TaxID=1903072 RepID=UPI00356347EF
MNIHEKYIKRCIQLAQNGIGTTYPNPMVGSVIVHEDKIIGEGWHRVAGEPHAEVLATRSVKDESLLKHCTIYVSLEPCSHYGKTPPCSDLIIAKGIKRVVIGSVDPFAEVSGRGIKKLLDAGCEVQVGILEKEGQWLNRRFFTFHQQKRPYIILKWAQSLDAFIAPEKQEKREPVWITNPHSNQLVHKWRSEEQGILVGTQTAVADNPRLNTRFWDGPDPVRIVLDRNLRIPKDSALFDGSVKTIVFTEDIEKAFGHKNLIFEGIKFGRELPEQICEVLYRHEIQSVIIEGGAKTLQTFIDSGLWDEARVFTGNNQLRNGVKAPGFSGKLISERTIKNDNLKIYIND